MGLFNREFLDTLDVVSNTCCGEPLVRIVPGRVHRDRRACLKCGDLYHVGRFAGYPAYSRAGLNPYRGKVSVVSATRAGASSMWGPIVLTHGRELCTLDAIVGGFTEALSWAEYVRVEGDDSGFAGGFIEDHPAPRRQKDLDVIERKVRDILTQFDPDDVRAYFDHYGCDRAQGASHFGHDLYLTCAGHGAGFWDRGLGDLGDRLSAVCEQNQIEVWAEEHRGYLRIYVH